MLWVHGVYGFSGKEAIAVFRDNQHDIGMVLLDFLYRTCRANGFLENLRSSILTYG